VKRFKKPVYGGSNVSEMSITRGVYGVRLIENDTLWAQLCFKDNETYFPLMSFNTEHCDDLWELMETLRHL